MSTIRDLTPGDIGRTIRIRHGVSLREGVLTEIEAVGAQILTTSMLDFTATYVTGAVTARLVIDDWRSPEMRLDIEVEFP